MTGSMDGNSCECSEQSEKSQVPLSHLTQVVSKYSFNSSMLSNTCLVKCRFDTSIIPIQCAIFPYLHLCMNTSPLDCIRT